MRTVHTRARRRSKALTAIAIAAGIAVPASAAAEPETRTGTEADTVKVMEWNACGNNSDCKFYEDPDGLIATMRWHMMNNGEPADAAIFEEVCSSFAKKLEYDLEDHYGTGWDVRFAPIKWKQSDDPADSPNKPCVRDRGDYGIAIAVPDENTWWEARYLPSPDGTEWRVAMCATVESWSVKLCGAHFSSPGDDPDGTYRPRQVAAYQDFVAPSRFQVVFGGDLNLQPPADAGPELDPLYDHFVECAQSSSDADRTGPGTYYRTDPHDNDDVAKLDYLFTDPGAGHECGIPGGVVESSDHRPIWITTELTNGTG